MAPYYIKVAEERRLLIVKLVKIHCKPLMYLAFLSKEMALLWIMRHSITKKLYEAVWEKLITHLVWLSCLNPLVTALSDDDISTLSKHSPRFFSNYALIWTSLLN